MQKQNEAEFNNEMDNADLSRKQSSQTGSKNESLAEKDSKETMKFLQGEVDSELLAEIKDQNKINEVHRAENDVVNDGHFSSLNHLNATGVPIGHKELAVPLSCRIDSPASQEEEIKLCKNLLDYTFEELQVLENGIKALKSNIEMRQAQVANLNVVKEKLGEEIDMINEELNNLNFYLDRFRSFNHK